MDSVYFIFIIGGLFLVIISEFVFLYVLLEREQREKSRLLDELGKLNAALSAKSAQEYVMMRSIDSVRAAEKPAAPEGVDSSELNDEEYDRMLKAQLKTG